ncbi:hypothetical protein M8818_000968 [Zalaria obscura]|uniref:Uncharacterized protein n=1 Tax=Zalaria obscura TaxID=2024903 RepID=A0ACC3SLS6_9PEZI
MSDDEADPELLELLRKSLGISVPSGGLTSDTGVLKDAEYIYNNSIDVAIDMRGTQSAASLIWEQMQQRSYSTDAWSEHELHPKTKDEATANFIFTMDLLNFSFWSEKDETERFAVEYKDRKWTGYWSLVACLQRALDEEIPITTPSYWADDIKCTDEIFRHVFRSCTDESMPLLRDRIDCLRETGRILNEEFDGSVALLIETAGSSAGMLVNLLAHHFPSFNDETKFDRREVRVLKRAQIFVADLWAAFNGEAYGHFEDIDNITMFADYRVPQMLHTLGCLSYSPPLDYAIRSQKLLEPGHSWEVQLRGCSIWCVELLRRQILQKHPDAKVNAILIDFFLYDLAKEREKAGEDAIPHHRTRSICFPIFSGPQLRDAQLLHTASQSLCDSTSCNSLANTCHICNAALQPLRLRPIPVIKPCCYGLGCFYLLWCGYVGKFWQPAHVGDTKARLKPRTKREKKRID